MSLFAAGTALGQYIETYFPQSVPGYDQERGVTVLSRLRPAYEPLGLHAEDFILHPALDEETGYDSNRTGGAHGTGSWVIKTAPSVSATSDWSRDRLGFSLSVEDNRYLEQPSSDYTNWTLAIGGGYAIGEHDLDLSYAHLGLHELGTDIGAVASSTPVAFSVDDFRASYTIDHGRFSFLPSVDVQLFDFGNATILGAPTSQRYRNRDVENASFTTKYALTDQRALLFVLEGVNVHYGEPLAGQPSNDSRSFLALGGIDYPASGLWRYRALAGVEVRDFAAAQFPTRTAPVIEATAIYTPTELTTLTGTLERTIEDVAAEGTGGYTYSQAKLVADHELKRNVLLQGRLNLQSAEYLQGGGSSVSTTVGGGVTWLVNRNLRLSLDYDFTRQNGTNTAAGQPSDTLVAGSYTRHLVLLNLHIGA